MVFAPRATALFQIKYHYKYMSDSKQKIISYIYFDRAGFQSKSNTLKDAREKDKTITMKDVDEFIRKNVEIKKEAKRNE